MQGKSGISQEKHIPDLNFSSISRCGKGIYEMQNSILRNPITAETAQKRRKVFQVLSPGSSATDARLKLPPKAEQFVGCWAPLGWAKCTKPLQDTALTTWVTQPTSSLPLCTTEADDCWRAVSPPERGEESWCRAQLSS